MQGIRRALPPLLAILTLLLGGCAGEPRTTEEEILATLDAVESAVEVGDVGVVKEFISPGYRDARGNDRRALAAWLTLRIMEQRTRYVLKRVRTLDVTGDRAEIVVVAGMAGSPIEGPEDFLDIRAEIYTIDLVLERESDEVWRVIDASWKKARAADLI